MTQSQFSSPEIAQRVEEWTSEKMDATMRAEVQALVDSGATQELEERFYKTLEFGTGGLRGLIGAGTNRMNRIIVAQATQGLATYVLANAEKPGPIRAAIAHDSRHFSREFAETAASVLAANGIIVHICPEIRPTPWLSYSVRRLGCHTGIVVTASHNPKEYNGYKVYWDDGSQVVPPHDKGIIAEVNKVTGMSQVKIMDFDEGVAQGVIQIAGQDTDTTYLDAVREQSLRPDTIKANPVKIVYTPLHGVGGTMTPTALEQWGFGHVYPEPEQMKPDGDFPTAASPNPEEGEALARAIELAKGVDGDLVLATDPDADRLGIAVLHEGEYRLVTGNQLSCLIGDYLLRTRRELGTLPPKAGIVSTIVTTPLLRSITESHGAAYAEGLTGFKWIAKQARDWDNAGTGIEFLYGTEESYGYLIGRHAMDKDGVVASCVTAEMAAWLKSRGMTIIDYLEEIYLQYGPRVEWQKSVVMPGMDGAEKIAALMKTLTDNPPREIGGFKVVQRVRVDTGEILDGQTDAKLGTIDLPSSKVVVFELEDGSKAIGRPSGTEPKIKFYFFLQAERQSDVQGVRTALKELNRKKSEFQSAFLKAVGAE